MRWTKRVQDPTGRRVKANQVTSGGRKEWIRGRRREKEEALRYYERKPRDYPTNFPSSTKYTNEEGKTLGIPTSVTPVTPVIRGPSESRPIGTQGTEEPGFWNRVEEAEGKRREEWRKGVGRKQTRGKGKRSPWDRSAYRKGSGVQERRKRRSVVQDQRRGKARDHPIRKGQSVVERERRGWSEETKERKGSRRREGDQVKPRRERGYDELAVRWEGVEGELPRGPHGPEGPEGFPVLKERLESQTRWRERQDGRSETERETGGIEKLSTKSRSRPKRFEKREGRWSPSKQRGERRRNRTEGKKEREGRCRSG